MAEFLTRKKTASQVEDIIKNAKKELVLISPYLQLSDDLVVRLKDADKRKSVKMELVYTDEERNPDQEKKVQEQIQKLQSLKNLSISRLKHLHAKCYYNEECMIITSMNLYDYSERNNWEMGLLIRRQEEEKVFDQVRAEAESIIKESENVKPRESLVHKAVKFGRLVGDLLTEEESKGYCIRCKTSIPYNLGVPLCHDCWEKWNVHKKASYKEKFCHSCGEPTPTSKAKPLCDSCYDRSQR